MTLDLNLNTVLGGLCLAGILWLLKTTSSTKESVALIKQAQMRQETDTLDLRTRVLALEQHSRDQDMEIIKLKSGASK